MKRTEAHKSHAAERALERYGVEVTTADLRRLAKYLLMTSWKKPRGNVLPVLKSPDGSERWLVNLACIGIESKVWLTTVFDRGKCVIVTFLQRDNRESHAS